MTASQKPPSASPLAEPRPAALRPHRGGAVLALGIVGLVSCVICGIIAWVMGAKDLKEMAAGRMDRSGEGMTRAGMICGIISVILDLAVIAFGLMVALVVLIAHGVFG